MKTFFRKTLKAILGDLSRRTLRKHGAEVILITGWSGTAIVRELVYSILSKKYNTRRITSEVIWDLSVPLCILGYKDKQRNFFWWLGLIVKAYFSLLIKPHYPHKIIINLDSSISDIAKFWSSALEAHIVVVLREKPDSKLLNQLLKAPGSERLLFVYNPEWFTKKVKNTREFTFSKDSSDLSFTKDGAKLTVSYKKEQLDINVPKQNLFILEFIPAALAVGLVEGLTLGEMVPAIVEFTPHPNQIKQLLAHLKEFVYEGEEKR